MPGSTWADFKKVKASVSIEDVLGHYGLLEKFDRKGDRLSGLCPIHKGSNKKQFSVSVSKGAWKCFSGHCGKQGNVIDLVAAVENIPFRDAAILLQEWFRIEPDSPLRSSSSRKPVEKGTEESPAAIPSVAEAPSATPPTGAPQGNIPLTFELQLEPKHPYLESRGLTPDTIAHFGLFSDQKLLNKKSLWQLIQIRKTSHALAFRRSPVETAIYRRFFIAVNKE